MTFGDDSQPHPPSHPAGLPETPTPLARDPISAHMEETLLYHFCRLHLPAVTMTATAFRQHLDRTYQLHTAHPGRDRSTPLPRSDYVAQLHALDWYLAAACLEGNPVAWEALFGMRTGRTDLLLIDALRSRAVRLFPRNEERQESSVGEFWSDLIAPPAADRLPILARFDGLRPLAPWLLVVFWNLHVRKSKAERQRVGLPDDEISPAAPERQSGRWHEDFRSAAAEWIGTLNDRERIILGLRLRYRLDQREVARVLGIHEGNVSKATTQLGEKGKDHILAQLHAHGWTGERDELHEFILSEMDSVLLDDPRLSADQLARLLATKGRTLPPDLPNRETRPPTPVPADRI